MLHGKLADAVERAWSESELGKRAILAVDVTDHSFEVNYKQVFVF